ncbi:MAG: DUF3299 domain-containing protein [Desulfovibrionaceae bacterium]|nr:DUF3299 domain-containing protein [Desulfovibrionaceae bacterium]
MVKNLYPFITRYIFLSFLILFLIISLCKLSLANESVRAIQEIQWEDLIIKNWGNEQQVLDEKNLAKLSENIRSAKPNPVYNHKMIRIKGFVVPIDRDMEGNLHSLLLVPYFGACIHVPPPPENQIIYVELTEPKADIRAMDNLKLDGTLLLENTDTGSAKTAYKMINARIVADDSRLSGIWGAILLTFTSGLSICLGWILPIRKIKISKGVYIFVVTLAAGMMLCLGLSSVLVNNSTTKTTLFIIAFLVMYFWSKFSADVNKKRHTDPLQSSDTAVACAFHNFPECFFILSTAIGNFSVGSLLTLTMMAHNIPLGLSLGIVANNIDIYKRIKYIVLAGVIPPILVLVIYICLRQFITVDTIRQIYPLAGGCLVSIALLHLLPAVLNKNNILSILAGLSSGIFIMIIALLFIY